MQRTLPILTILATLLVATGCSNRMWQDTKEVANSSYELVFDQKPTARSYHDEESIPLIEINYQAGDVLFHNVSKDELSENARLYFKFFHNARNAGDTSIFGQVVARQIADRLVQRGIHLTEGDPKPEEYFAPPKMAPKDDKEQTKDATDELPPRAAMLDGQYVIGDQYVYVTATITRLDDKLIVSAHNWTIPLSDNTRKLLGHPRPKDGMKPTVKTRFSEM